MKLITLFTLLLMSHVHAENVSFIDRVGNPETFSGDAASLSPMGRAITNASTNEKIELVCLDQLPPDQPCFHFQLRDTDQGIVKLIGSEMIVKTIPEEEFKKDADAKVAANDPNQAYHFMPWVTNLGTKMRDSSNSIACPIFYFATFLSDITVADFIVSIAKAPIIGVNNFFKNLKRKSNQKQVDRSLADLFNQTEVTDSALIIKDSAFILLKQTLTENMN